VQRSVDARELGLGRVRGARVGRLHVLGQSVERADERGVCGLEERPLVRGQLHEVHGALAAGVGAATAALGGTRGWSCAQEDDSAGEHARSCIAQKGTGVSLHVGAREE
jgi:hypothetical protein